MNSLSVCLFFVSLFVNLFLFIIITMIFQEWEQIQFLMGRQGKESLQKRVICRRPEDVHIEVADEVENIIQPYSMGKCRAVSNGICSFYKWVSVVFVLIKLSYAILRIIFYILKHTF